MIEAFDDAHAALKGEKLGLEADVKAGEMRLLVMLQELQLLREFDKRESVLLQKRQAKLDDKQEIVDKITECTDKLEQKRGELEGLITRRAAVIAELDAILPETDPYREPLVRIFHRRIKRSKKKAGGGDDDYDSEDDDDDDDMGAFNYRAGVWKGGGHFTSLATRHLGGSIGLQVVLRTVETHVLVWAATMLAPASIVLRGITLSQSNSRQNW